jgi:hypothetical protein
MEAKWIVALTIVALLAGLVGGILGTSPAFGGAMMRMGMSPMMTPQMMMTPQTMVEMCRQAMADPALRIQMLEMHRQMHDEIERR